MEVMRKAIFLRGLMVVGRRALAQSIKGVADHEVHMLSHGKNYACGEL